jgi:hypothetical protein
VRAGPVLAGRAETNPCTLMNNMSTASGARDGSRGV